MGYGKLAQQSTSSGEETAPTSFAFLATFTRQKIVQRQVFTKLLFDTISDGSASLNEGAWVVPESGTYAVFVSLYGYSSVSSEQIFATFYIDGTRERTFNQHEYNVFTDRGDLTVMDLQAGDEVAVYVFHRCNGSIEFANRTTQFGAWRL